MLTSPLFRLAELYLNAEVYTGTERYADAATYAEKVISSGKYSLHPTYANLFLATTTSATLRSSSPSTTMVRSRRTGVV